MKKAIKLVLFIFLQLLYPAKIFAAIGADGEAFIGSVPLSDCTKGVNSSLGFIPSDPVCLVKWILGNSILLGGGLAFLLSIYGGITLLLASGNPEKIVQAKQTITSAISGLLIIIFSLIILRFIGVNILQIPGFGAS